MLFSKISVFTTALIGMSSMLVGVAALPTDASEMVARSINPAGTHTGKADYYHPAGYGACGFQNSDADFVAAISAKLFDNYPGYAGGNPNKNPVCGRTARVIYKGKTVRVKIVERYGAGAVWDIGLSPSAFKQLAPLDAVPLHDVTWYFN
ncbi:hypothetical protein FRC08_006973 [Ceratobasidium sp. 394]|nr:hypothetical protein FRC08_006973 [Ceratobasidium sp. 394]KAG9083600.1 hypothetical protein FS749_005910 [Ceratobasidium sp. UAMH 11750]